MQSKLFTYANPGPLPLTDADWPRTIYGIRVVPILFAGESAIDAYASLGCSYTARNMQGGPTPGPTDITRTFAIDGPSFFPIYEAGQLAPVGGLDPKLTGGVDGLNYRVWIARSIDEAIIGGSSFASGMAPIPGSTKETTETGVNIPNGDVPPGALDGIAVGPSGKVALKVAATDGVSTINAVGSLGCWIVPALEADPVRSPDFDIVITQGGEVDFDFGARAFGVFAKRVIYRPIGMALTGGGNTVDLTYTTA